MAGATPAPNAAQEFVAGLGPLVFDGAWGRHVKEYLTRARARLFEDYLAGVSGRWVVERYTAAVDHAVQTLFAAAREEYARNHAVLDQSLALVAQGGYGRGELNPQSDIDLLFIYPYRRDPYGETVTERVVYSLFDTGLQVGHAFRNLRDCVTLAARDFKVKTALLDLRFIAGDRGLYDEFARAMDKDVLKRNARRYFSEKLAENEERHRRYGDSVYIVQPHLKDGEGGLRDLHTAMWLAKVKFHTNSIAELAQKGVVTKREQEEVEAARDFLWRARNGLHFHTGRHEDQLTFEFQERLAADFGYRDDGKTRGVEQFTRDFYLAASTVNRFSQEIISRCTEQRLVYRLGMRFGGRTIRPGVRIAAGELVVGDPATFAGDPVHLLRVFHDCQLHGVALSGSTRRAVRAHAERLDEAVRRSGEAVSVFLGILRWKQGVAAALREMHKLGVLSAMLPEFAHLLCMAQYDQYHLYTVDEHSLRAVGVLEQLRLGAYKDAEPLLTEVVRAVENVEVLYLGMLLHDVGKGLGGDHSNRGAAMAVAIADRLGFNADERGELEFLVRHHLTMHHLATRRDIHDEQLVIEFARTCRTPECLKKLYLLTFADLRAVNPKMWNAWHGSLLGELYVGALSVFERGAFVPGDQAERVARIRERAGRQAPAGDAAAYADFLADMPDRYFLSAPEAEIPLHFDLVRRCRDAPFVTDVRHFPEREFSEFTVVTADRPGLFSKIAGALAANGMNILTASIVTSRSGVALDVFRVSHFDRAEIVRSADRWDRVQASLARVLSGEVDVEQLVAAARRPGLLDRRFVPRVGTKVEIDNAVSEHFTVVDVYTQDRAGLLFSITNALYHLNLSIHLAKITTNVDQVLDVFYVTDENGRKIGDQERLEHIRAVLLEALTRPAGDPEEASSSHGRGD